MAKLNPTDRVPCRTPSSGKTGTVNVPKWKFDCIRSAILGILKVGDTPWKELTERVRKQLDASEVAAMGSLGWYVVTVKLELEVRGEIRRIVGEHHQILTLGSVADAKILQ